ncbi:MAG TPA: cytochrome-c oxidase, cbb3-type subunit II, partial [Caulobacteraceae bacterium]|nr:cytochrome-c oxidase, cbb3-type subunit II [Caulobacteraceae bacterium]
YTQAQIDNAEDDAVNQADEFGGTAVKKRYGQKLAQRDFDGDPDRLTEMDALIAYLQGLGNQVDVSTYKASENVR